MIEELIRDNFLTLSFGPLLVQNVEHKSFSSHRVLSSVTRCTTEQYNFLLGHDRHGVSKAGLRNLSIHFDIFNMLPALNYCVVFRSCSLGVLIAIHDYITGKTSWLLIIGINATLVRRAFTERNTKLDLLLNSCGCR